MTGQAAIRILIVDDHPFLRDAVAALIANQSDMILLSEAASAGEGIQLYHELQPDVTLMDLRLPDLNGIEAVARIRANVPDARILILTTFSGNTEVQAALDAGARGYVLKSAPSSELLNAIRQVHAGGIRVPADFKPVVQPKALGLWERIKRLFRA